MISLPQQAGEILFCLFSLDSFHLVNETVKKMAEECFLVETKRIKKAIFSQPRVFLRIQVIFNKVCQEGCGGGRLRQEAT